MSIKRITRRRIAAPFTDHEVSPNDARTGGNVETKMNPPVQSAIGGDTETRVDTRVETKASPALQNNEGRFGADTQSRAGTNVETRSNTDVASSNGKDVPQLSRWSI
jgi:hypothetical protein